MCSQKHNANQPRTEQGKLNVGNAARKMRGSKHPNWKGDKVGYTALHSYIHKWLPKPEFCVDCKKVPPLDVANISQKYLRDFSDWEWLCRKCHLTKDGRLERFHAFGK